MLTGMLAGCSGDSQKAAENTASTESTAEDTAASGTPRRYEHQGRSQDAGIRVLAVRQDRL